MSDRSRAMRTDESAASASSITESLRNLLLDTWNGSIDVLSDAELHKSTPEHILGRMLSTKSAISTASALAEINQRAHDDKALQTFASIGSGQCGTIYALKGTTMVIKLPKSPEKQKALLTDFECHRLAYQAFKGVSTALRVHVNIPALRMMVGPGSHDFWGTKTALFEDGVQVPDYGIAERKHDFLGMQKNKDCLIRLYLGRRNDDAPPVAADKFHLRNFPLHVNEMERLKLDTPYFAELMAQALAILHWRAGLDANDVEFVFGGSPQISELPTDEDMVGVVDIDTVVKLFRSDFHHRTISVWLLDFNMCQKFNKDNNGLKQLVDAFYWNDPYYLVPQPPPRKTKICGKSSPCGISKSARSSFRTICLRNSSLLLKSELRNVR